MDVHPKRPVGRGGAQAAKSDATDAALVAEALACRDEAAFGELVRRHQGRVRGYLGRVASDAALADDLAKDMKKDFRKVFSDAKSELLKKRQIRINDNEVMLYENQ